MRSENIWLSGASCFFGRQKSSALSVEPQQPHIADDLLTRFKGACKAHDVSLIDPLPGHLESPRLTYQSMQAIGARALPLGSEAAQAQIQTAFARHLEDNDIDTLAFTNAYLDHIEQDKAAPASPLGALSTLRLDATCSRPGADAASLTAKFLCDANLQSHGWLVPALGPPHRIEGLSAFNHVAGVVSFANPSDDQDAGIIVIDGVGMHLPKPFAVLWCNSRDNAVTVSSPERPERLTAFIEDGLVHVQRWLCTPSQSKLSVGEIVLTLATLHNPQTAITSALLAVQHPQRIVARNAQGQAQAQLHVDIIERNIRLVWQDRRVYVPFAAVDAAGAWLDDHAPCDAPDGFAKALHHDTKALAQRVHQVVRNVDLLCALRQERLDNVQSPLWRLPSPQGLPAAAP